MARESGNEQHHPSDAGDDADRWATLGIDTATPHAARMYDWWLGGHTNFGPDRELGQAFMQAIPSIRTMATENRKFLARAVRYLAAEAGIHQFLDIGTGIPTEGNVHEVAQQIAPTSHVVYVDNDPIVLAHARTLMSGDDRGQTAYIQADLRQPETILTDGTVTATLDFNQPIALLMIAILMLLSDSEDPWGKAKAIMDALPAGSYVAITHPGRDFDPEAMEQIVATAQQGDLTVIPRNRADVERFFEDWELVDPGVVPVVTWRPDDGSFTDPNTAYYWAGLARKR